MKIITILSLAIFFVIIFFGGCSFLVPEDDLNGNNEKIEKFIELLDVEKKSEVNSQDSVQTMGQQKTQIPSHSQSKKELPFEKMKEQSDSEMEKRSMEYVEKYKKATIVTNYGDIKVEFFNDDAPLAVGNFTRLAEEGFYDEIKFHRVIKEFMIQGGDPNSKDDEWSDDGQGGPGYSFKDEFNDHKLVRGSLAMANSGSNTNGSQFFIVIAKKATHLDGKHTNFGKVFEGMDVVDKIEEVEVNEKDHPTEDVIIEKIRLR